MAIVNMKKISIVCLRSDEKKLLDLLMKQGVTQVADIDEEGLVQRFDHVLIKNDRFRQLSDLDTRMKTVRSAIDILARYVDAKKVMFAPRRSVKKTTYREILAQKDEVLAFAENVIDMVSRQNELKAEKNRIQGEIHSLEHWKSFTLPLDKRQTASCHMRIGILPDNINMEIFQAELEDKVPLSALDVIGKDKDAVYICVFCHNSQQEQLGTFLNGAQFSAISLEEHGIAADAIKTLRGAVQNIDKKQEQLSEKLKEAAENKLHLELLYDYMLESHDKLEAAGKLAGTKSTIFMRGWVPAEAADAVSHMLTENFLCEVEIEDPQEEEAYPILLRNPKVIQPFETVTEMYSLPAPYSLDPNKIMAPFFFLFFGMMVSDAGYGLILTLATAFIVYKFKPEGQAGKLMRLLCLGGISTFIWGIIFGGYFGDTIPVIVKMVTGYTIQIPSLLNPSADPISVLILSLALGLIHLFVAMGAKAYLLIKRGHVWDAVFDIGFWYLVLGGIALFCVGMAFPQTVIGQIGVYVTVAGAIGLILTQGRAKKNIFAKLISGVGSLYDIVSYMSDILSYSRLLALGLSTGVVASVVNTMGSMGGNTIGGWIMFVLVFIVGHVFNLAINTLGAYVHSSRLQYVEFFGKFYESGGKAFKPLKENRKYTQLIDDEESYSKHNLKEEGINGMV